MRRLFYPGGDRPTAAARGEAWELRLPYLPSCLPACLHALRMSRSSFSRSAECSSDCARKKACCILTRPVNTPFRLFCPHFRFRPLRQAPPTACAHCPPSMIDHLLGRPSTSLKRLQVLAVLALWATILRKTPRQGPKRLTWLRWADKHASRFAPWKVVVSTLMLLYTVRHVDDILGVGAPEPLARMYSRSFYRVTWIVTALDAGFATAMNVKPNWLRDILSVVFSMYYVLYANEADEKLRKYRAFCTVEMLRYTWEKTTNPYIRMATWFHRPSLPIARPILLPRPTIGAHSKRPINAWLFYAGGKESELAKEEELYLDFPGGGFICMNPLHHEERLRQLAKEVGKPILAIDYCKAPEYPFPYAIQECFDVYRTLVETRGKAIGMSGSSRFRMVLSGDSAGGNIATAVMLQILEYPQPHIREAYANLASNSRPPPLPKPLCMVLAYPSLNFSFTAWMKPEYLRVLKAQSEVNLENLRMQAVKDAKNAGGGGDGKRGSPLRPRSRSRSRQNSVSRLAGQFAGNKTSRDKLPPPPTSRDSTYMPLASQAELHLADRARLAGIEPSTPPEDQDAASIQRPASAASSSRTYHAPTAADLQDKETRFWQNQPSRSIESREEEEQRLLAEKQQRADAELIDRKKKAPLGTRLTMTSMSGYFQDRILTQSMMRAMCICYLGNRRQPDFDNDYLLSPVVAPARLLAEFPPVLFICGEKDPICDDTVIMAGRIREAKLAKQAEVRRRRAGVSARFGEGLRMSAGQDAGGAGDAAAADPIEDEDVEDWVQMRIIASVSHGLLQMGALWPEAKHIISFIAAWVVEAFEEENEVLAEIKEMQMQAVDVNGASRSQTMPAPTTIRPADEASSPAARVDSSAIEADDEEEEEEEEALTFTPRSMRSPSMRSPSLSTPRVGGELNNGPPPAGKSPSVKSPTEKPQPPAVLSLKAAHGVRGRASGGGGGGSEGGDATDAAPSSDLLPNTASANGSSARTRPSSFSDIKEARERAAAAAQGLLSGEAPAPDTLTVPLADPSDIGIGASSSVPATRATSPHGRGISPSPTTGGRRTSRGPAAAAMDDRTKALLVNENSLLQRRRLEAVSGLGSSAVHDGSSEEEEEEDERGRGRGSGRGAAI